MLKKWIDEIQGKPDLYKTNCWKYHISGNVIELSILPVYLKEKKAYRCSVISIGQVLKVLSCKIEQHQANFHIQSFPSLENPEIVASIRMDQTSDFIRNAKSKKDGSVKKRGSITNRIKVLAREYQLDIKTVESTTELNIEYLPFDQYNRWLALYSTFNNPFTWLNIGYFKEALLKDCYNDFTLKNLHFSDFCSNKDNHITDLQLPDNKYLQSLVGIEPVNSSIEMP